MDQTIHNRILSKLFKNLLFYEEDVILLFRPPSGPFKLEGRILKVCIANLKIWTKPLVQIQKYMNEYTQSDMNCQVLLH